MDPADLIAKLVLTLLLLVPPYVANGTPPVITKILRKKCTPIDLGRVFIDGRRLFGDGKTFEGFLGGVLAGYSISLIVYRTLRDLVSSEVATVLYKITPLDVATLCILALLGDLIGAFIKRRLGLPRGAPAPLLDQLDFLVLPLLYIHVRLQVQDPTIYVTAITLTILLHLSTNYVAYRLGIKSEPW